MSNILAYAPDGVLEFKGSPKKVVAALLRDKGVNWSAETIQRWSLTDKNAVDIYPITQTGSPPTVLHTDFTIVNTGIVDGYWTENRVYGPPNINKLRSETKNKIDAWKLQKQNETFDYIPVGNTVIMFDNDDKVKQHISSASFLALVNKQEIADAIAANTTPPSAFTINWTSANNDVFTLDSTQMIELAKTSTNKVIQFNDAATTHKNSANGINNVGGFISLIDGLEPIRGQEIEE